VARSVAREGLRSSDRAAIERIVRAVGIFREEEIAVALELVDVGLSGDDKGYRFLVADDGPLVLGYACFGRASMTDGTYDLYWIAVDPAAQHRGVGRGLLREVEEAIRREGGRLLLVETEDGPGYERTRRFYEAAGYPEVARVRDYYRVGRDKVVHARDLREGR